MSAGQNQSLIFSKHSETLVTNKAGFIKGGLQKCKHTAWMTRHKYAHTGTDPLAHVHTLYSLLSPHTHTQGIISGMCVSGGRLCGLRKQLLGGRGRPLAQKNAI